VSAATTGAGFPAAGFADFSGAFAGRPEGCPEVSGAFAGRPEGFPEVSAGFPDFSAGFSAAGFPDFSAGFSAAGFPDFSAAGFVERRAGRAFSPWGREGSGMLSTSRLTFSV